MAHQDNCVQISSRGVSRRTLVAGIAAGAGVDCARAAECGGGRRTPSRRPARSPARRAISGLTAPRTPISPTPMCSLWIRASTAFVSRIAPIQRLWTGALWAGGASLELKGRYLVFSDIPNNRQMRWLEDDGRVTCSACPPTTATAIRSTSRVGRSVASIWAGALSVTSLMVLTTIIADNYNGKRLNSPNDVVAHPDGSLWFTDPPYGGQLYEGSPDAVWRTVQ